MSGHIREKESAQQIDSNISLKTAEGSDKKMKITDLNIICIEEIFEYLDLLNLMNVADSNKRLNIAARFVYRRKHGKKCVILMEFISDNRLKMESKQFRLSGANDSLQFLRCFGCVISDLRCYLINETLKTVDRLCFYINEYCAESLIKLGMCGRGTDAIIFANNQRPFVNIETLVLTVCRLGTNVMQFNKLFPKMRNLTLSSNRMVENECNDMHFPDLRSLKYDLKPMYCGMLIPHLENVIRLNPNLRSLEISYWDRELIPKISKYLPQLEEFKIFTLYDGKPNYGIDQLHFKSLKKFKCSQSNILSEFEFSCDQLEEIFLSDQKINNLVNFIEKNSTLKIIGLIFYDLSNKDVLQLAKTLPPLSQLNMCIQKKISVDEAIHFVNELKQIKEFSFKKDDDDRSIVNDLRARLGGIWKVFSHHPNEVQIMCD